MRHLRIITNILLLSLPLYTALSLLPPSSASALSGSSFNPGRIIDDSVFYDGSVMNTTQVQSFLNSKVPTCDTNGLKRYTGSAAAKDYNGDGIIQRWERGKYAGYPAPYTCLKSYKQNTPSIVAESGICDNFTAKTGRTAAGIITDVALACGINPEVLIVLLQKEQGLVTDDWPWSYQYQKATGYACPDTAPCNTAYYGFFNQVYHAARQFKRYQADPTNWNYVAGQNNKIYYNPNTACGYSWVNIQNQATAGLYDYTPYQPNKAALDNLYGTGNSCSAYGNRNFWRYFNDWFGSTLAPSYHASYAGQSLYPTVTPGTSTSVFLKYKNAGGSSWYDDTSVSSAPFGTKPVHLATANPINHSSYFSATWPASSRPAYTFAAVYESDGTTLAANQHVVQPGQIARFNFTISVSVDQANGDYKEYYQPVVEGTPTGMFKNPNTWLVITVPKQYKAAFAGQSHYPTIPQNNYADVYMKFKNTGYGTWYDDTSAGPAGVKPIHLAATNPINRLSKFSAAFSAGPYRPTGTFAAVYESDGTTLAANQHVVQPGQIARFNFRLSAPQTLGAGTYREYFQPILEGGSPWGMDGYAYLDVRVTTN